jgi:hypothetical protein
MAVMARISPSAELRPQRDAVVRRHSEYVYVSD